tara:strand:+ start:2131 stop:3822 length:1692 start_codon:yes stop_codon:yes gene_type:complete
MKPEPLTIDDKRFLINRLIRQAPTGTLVREFFKNADENAALAPYDNRKILIYPVMIEGVRKVAFWNTGVGMDDTDLKKATNLSSSINKKMALDENFGIGAKVSGLTVSPEGIRYRSCKNGVVNEVIIGFDPDEETYVRFPVELPDGTFDTVYEVTEAAVSDGQSIEFDWTEVVLLGETPDHDTVTEPLGKGVVVDRSYIATTIFKRFAAFSPNVEVRIDVSMTKGGGKDETGKTRQLKTLEQIIDKLPRHERVTCPEGLITIHYTHDPKHQNYSHSLSALANPATASTTFCAVVHKGERYDYKHRKAWSAAAPNFGIPFGSKVLSIEIEIPDGMALPNQYRDGLTWPGDRSPLVAEQFDDYVRELMPDWVKDVIREQSPEPDDNLDDLQSDLQKLLDEFRVPTVTLSPTRKPSALPTAFSDEGTDTSEPVNMDTEFDGLLDEIDRTDEDDQQPKSQRAKEKKVRKAPEGARPSKSSQALERVPKIEILTDAEEIAEKNLKGRAGRYYKDAQTLFINGLYSVVDRMVADLEPDLRSCGEAEVVRSAALKASQRFMAFRVGKAAC